MRSLIVQCGPYSAAAANSIVTSVTPTNGTALTLVTNTVDTTPRRLLVTAALAEGNPETLLITGTTWGGQAATETLAITTATTTFISALDYQTVTSIVPTGSLAWTQAITIGTTASTTVGSSTYLRMDDYGFSQAHLQVDVNGTITFSVEGSNSDPNVGVPAGITTSTPLITPAKMAWISPDSTNLTGKNASLVYQLGAGAVSTGGRPMWLRLTITAVTGAATATMTVYQAGGFVV